MRVTEFHIKIDFESWNFQRQIENESHSHKLFVEILSLIVVKGALLQFQNYCKTCNNKKLFWFFYDFKFCGTYKNWINVCKTKRTWIVSIICIQQNNLMSAPQHLFTKLIPAKMWSDYFAKPRSSWNCQILNETEGHCPSS